MSHRVVASQVPPSLTDKIAQRFLDMKLSAHNRLSGTRIFGSWRPDVGTTRIIDCVLTLAESYEDQGVRFEVEVANRLDAPDTTTLADPKPSEPIIQGAAAELIKNKMEELRKLVDTRVASLLATPATSKDASELENLRQWESQWHLLGRLLVRTADDVD